MQSDIYVTGVPEREGRGERARKEERERLG